MGLCCRSPWLTWDTVNGVDFSKILREQRLVITDESIGVSQLLGVHMPGLPSKVYAYGHHILDVGHWLMWAYASILGLGVGIGGLWVSMKYYYISCNVQDFQMRTLSKKGDFS